jgi:hypothetical protein
MGGGSQPDIGGSEGAYRAARRNYKEGTMVMVVVTNLYETQKEPKRTKRTWWHDEWMRSNLVVDES